jgi:hypothetical protein
MAPSTPDTENRAQVWTALAELFVARELQDYDYRSIAETLRAAQIGAVELADILRDEVAPAFMGNLSGLNPVPEMEGWSENEVRERVRAAMMRSRGWGQRLFRSLRADPLRHPALQERYRILLGLLRII